MLRLGARVWLSGLKIAANSTRPINGSRTVSWGDFIGWQAPAWSKDLMERTLAFRRRSVSRCPRVADSVSCINHAILGRAGVDNEWNVSAVMVRSLTWDQSAFAKAPTRHPRHRFESEAIAWQLASQRGGWAAFCSSPDHSAGRRARRKDPSRMVELHAMIGAIGEQAGLCWGFEQDAQRFDATRRKISEEHHRLVLRALSELGGHFLLGAAHSLGNLGLRIALLDPQAGQAIQAAKPCGVP